RVRSAHAVGTVTDIGSIYRGIPGGQQRVELWYLAPDSYRLDIGEAPGATEIPPATVILAGRKGYYVSRRGAPRVRPMAPGAIMTQILTFSILSRSGAIEIAAAARGAVVRSELQR